MSRILPFRCPVENCRFHNKVIYAEDEHFKRHLRDDHDYKDYQETAFKLGLIFNQIDRRSPSWFIDHITEASIVKENLMEI